MSFTHLPRWTVYPALAVILGLLFLAVPHAADPTSSGAARELRAGRQVPSLPGAAGATGATSAQDDGELDALAPSLREHE